MSALDFFNHIFNFALPAIFMAFFLPSVVHVLLPSSQSPDWSTQVAVQIAVGLLILVLGLVVFGRDGKMLTYAALVLGCASCQWWMSRR